MQSFLLGYGVGDGLQAARQCLERIGTPPPGANLGFLYATDALAPELDAILEYLKRETRIAHWVGSVGIGICCSGREFYDAKALTVMVASFPHQAFRVLPTVKDGLEAFQEHDAWSRQSNACLGVVHGDPHNASTPELIVRLADHLPGGFLVGGLTSSNDGGCLHIADQITSGGISGVLFSDQVPVATALTQGCTPLGAKHVITECERNIAIRIDGRPALDVLFEDIGEVLARDLNKAAGYIFVGLPIPGSDTGDYLVRNLIGIDTENKLLAVGDWLQPGASLMFCRRDGRSAWEDMQRMLAELKRRTTQVPKGGLYYSCLGRGRHLFGDDSAELKAIQHQLGDFPLVGFFANGEISHNRLYGYTGVLTLFL